MNPGSASAGPATQVLCLMNMINVEDLEDDEEYDGNDTFLLWCGLFGLTLNAQEVPIGTSCALIVKVLRDAR